MARSTDILLLEKIKRIKNGGITRKELALATGKTERTITTYLKKLSTGEGEKEGEK